MTTTRTLDWRHLMSQADPDFNEDSRVAIEYEFSGAARGDDRVHEGSRRIFKADYQARGPYATGSEPTPATLTFPTVSRTLDWNHFMAVNDPDFAKDARQVVEYEFSSHRSAFDRTHEANKRVFKADYQARGPYATISAEDGALTWSGGLITWNGYQLTWNA